MVHVKGSSVDIDVLNPVREAMVVIKKSFLTLLLTLLATNAFAAAGVAGGANITARMMTNPRFVKWLAQAPKVRRAEIPKHLKALSTIAGVGNTELNEDILSYIESITLENE